MAFGERFEVLPRSLPLLCARMVCSTFLLHTFRTGWYLASVSTVPFKRCKFQKNQTAYFHLPNFFVKQQELNSIPNTSTDYLQDVFFLIKEER